ncbi:MAG TPA: hypothetical protein DC047_03545 [Blastocatellia bacterium]|nr:hypothetical protein [Blastocatellia bacterium]
MRHTIIVAILFLIAGSHGFAGQPDANAQANRSDAGSVQTETEWIKFVSPEGRFSLLLPRMPKVDVVTDPTDPKLTHNRFSELEDGYGFVIEAFDNVLISVPETYLDGASKGIVDTIHGSLIRENKISLDGYPGRELEFSLTANDETTFAGRTRLYAVGNSFYSMSFVWRTDIDKTQASKIGDKYFSSIKIHPPK